MLAPAAPGTAPAAVAPATAAAAVAAIAAAGREVVEGKAADGTAVEAPKQETKRGNPDTNKRVRYSSTSEREPYRLSEFDDLQQSSQSPSTSLHPPRLQTQHHRQSIQCAAQRQPVSSAHALGAAMQEEKDDLMGCGSVQGYRRLKR